LDFQLNETLIFAKILDTMAALSEQEIIRREKLERLRASGINPYPAPLYPVSDSSASIKDNFVEGKEVIIAGRLMSRRIQGKAMDIQDEFADPLF